MALPLRRPYLHGYSSFLMNKLLYFYVCLSIAMAGFALEHKELSRSMYHLQIPFLFDKLVSLLCGWVLQEHIRIKITDLRVHGHGTVLWLMHGKSDLVL